MSEPRKIRQCPYCKGKTGILVTVRLSGYQQTKLSFQGKIIDADQQGADDIISAECLDCKKGIDTEKLDLENA